MEWGAQEKKKMKGREGIKAAEEKAGGGAVFSASSVWYVAGRCWPLRLCHIYFTQVSPSHLYTLPGPERWGGGLWGSLGWITGCTSDRFTDIWRKMFEWSGSKTVKSLLALHCEFFCVCVLSLRTWWVQKKWPTLNQSITTVSLRAWETTRSPSWPSGGKNPKQSGTPERSQTDILNACSSSSVPPLMTTYQRMLTSTDRHFPTVFSSKSTSSPSWRVNG